MASFSALALGFILILTSLWLLGTRMLVSVLSFVLARLGIRISIKELGWMRMRGLVLHLKKGPLSRLELREAQLQMLPQGLLCLIQGKTPVCSHLQLDGLNLWLPGKQGGSKKKTKKSSAAPALHAHPQALRKKGKKVPNLPPSILRYLPRFSLGLSDVRIVHEPSGACIISEGLGFSSLPLAAVSPDPAAAAAAHPEMPDQTPQKGAPSPGGIKASPGDENGLAANAPKAEAAPLEEHQTKQLQGQDSTGKPFPGVLCALVLQPVRVELPPCAALPAPADPTTATAAGAHAQGTSGPGAASSSDGSGKRKEEGLRRRGWGFMLGPKADEGVGLGAPEEVFGCKGVTLQTTLSCARFQSRVWVDSTCLGIGDIHVNCSPARLQRFLDYLDASAPPIPLSPPTKDPAAMAAAAAAAALAAAMAGPQGGDANQAGGKAGQPLEKAKKRPVDQLAQVLGVVPLLPAQAAFNMGAVHLHSGYQPTGDIPPPPIHVTASLTAFNVRLESSYTGLPPPFDAAGPRAKKPASLLSSVICFVLRVLKKKGKAKTGSGTAHVMPSEPSATGTGQEAAAPAGPTQPAKHAANVPESVEAESTQGTGGPAPTWALNFKSSVVEAECGVLLDLPQFQQRPGAATHADALVPAVVGQLGQMGIHAQLGQGVGDLGVMCSLGINLAGLSSMLQCGLLDLTASSAVAAQAGMRAAMAKRTAAKQAAKAAVAAAAARSMPSGPASGLLPLSQAHLSFADQALHVSTSSSGRPGPSPFSSPPSGKGHHPLDLPEPTEWESPKLPLPPSLVPSSATRNSSVSQLPSHLGLASSLPPTSKAPQNSLAKHTAASLPVQGRLSPGSSSPHQHTTPESSPQALGGLSLQATLARTGTSMIVPPVPHSAPIRTNPPLHTRAASVLPQQLPQQQPLHSRTASMLPSHLPQPPPMHARSASMLPQHLQQQQQQQQQTVSQPDMADGSYQVPESATGIFSPLPVQAHSSAMLHPANPASCAPSLMHAPSMRQPSFPFDPYSAAGVDGHQAFLLTSKTPTAAGASGHARALHHTNSTSSSSGPSNQSSSSFGRHHAFQHQHSSARRRGGHPAMQEPIAEQSSWTDALAVDGQHLRASVHSDVGGVANAISPPAPPFEPPICYVVIVQVRVVDDIKLRLACDKMESLGICKVQSSSNSGAAQAGASGSCSSASIISIQQPSFCLDASSVPMYVHHHVLVPGSYTQQQQQQFPSTHRGFSSGTSGAAHGAEGADRGASETGHTWGSTETPASVTQGGEGAGAHAQQLPQPVDPPSSSKLSTQQTVQGAVLDSSMMNLHGMLSRAASPNQPVVSGPGATPLEAATLDAISGVPAPLRIPSNEVACFLSSPPPNTSAMGMPPLPPLRPSSTSPAVCTSPTRWYHIKGRISMSRISMSRSSMRRGSLTGEQQQGHRSLTNTPTNVSNASNTVDASVMRAEHHIGHGTGSIPTPTTTSTSHSVAGYGRTSRDTAGHASRSSSGTHESVRGPSGTSASVGQPQHASCTSVAIPDVEVMCSEASAEAHLGGVAEGAGPFLLGRSEAGSTGGTLGAAATASTASTSSGTHTTGTVGEVSAVNLVEMSPNAAATDAVEASSATRTHSGSVMACPNNGLSGGGGDQGTIEASPGFNCPPIKEGQLTGVSADGAGVCGTHTNTDVPGGAVDGVPQAAAGDAPAPAAGEETVAAAAAAGVSEAARKMPDAGAIEHSGSGGPCSAAERSESGCEGNHSGCDSGAGGRRRAHMPLSSEISFAGLAGDADFTGTSEGPSGSQMQNLSGVAEEAARVGNGTAVPTTDGHIIAADTTSTSVVSNVDGSGAGSAVVGEGGGVDKGSNVTIDSPAMATESVREGRDNELGQRPATLEAQNMELERASAAAAGSAKSPAMPEGNKPSHLTEGNLIAGLIRHGMLASPFATPDARFSGDDAPPSSAHAGIYSEKAPDFEKSGCSNAKLGELGSGGLAQASQPPQPQYVTISTIVRYEQRFCAIFELGHVVVGVQPPRAELSAPLLNLLSLAHFSVSLTRAHNTVHPDAAQILAQEPTLSSASSTPHRASVDGHALRGSHASSGNLEAHGKGHSDSGRSMRGRPRGPSRDATLTLQQRLAISAGLDDLAELGSPSYKGSSFENLPRQRRVTEHASETSRGTGGQPSRLASSRLRASDGASYVSGSPAAQSHGGSLYSSRRLRQTNSRLSVSPRSDRLPHAERAPAQRSAANSPDPLPRGEARASRGGHEVPEAPSAESAPAACVEVSLQQPQVCLDAAAVSVVLDAASAFLGALAALKAAKKALMAREQQQQQQLGRVFDAGLAGANSNLGIVGSFGADQMGAGSVAAAAEPEKPQKKKQKGGKKLPIHVVDVRMEDVLLSVSCPVQVLGNFSLATFRQKQQQQEQVREEDIARFQQQQEQEKRKLELKGQGGRRRGKGEGEGDGGPSDGDREQGGGVTGAGRSSHSDSKVQQTQHEPEQQQQQQQQEKPQTAPQWLYVSHQLLLPLTRVVLSPMEGRAVAVISGLTVAQTASALPIPAAPNQSQAPPDTLPPYSNTALSVANLELRSHKLKASGDGQPAEGADPSKPQQHLLRTSIDGVRAAVDFETLFLALGLAHWGTQQAAKLVSGLVKAGVRVGDAAIPTTAATAAAAEPATPTAAEHGPTAPTFAAEAAEDVQEAGAAPPPDAQGATAKQQQQQQQQSSTAAAAPPGAPGFTAATIFGPSPFTPDSAVSQPAAASTPDSSDAWAAALAAAASASSLGRSGSPGLSPVPKRPQPVEGAKKKAKVQMVLEARVCDLDVRALAGEKDVISLKIGMARGSSLLKEAVVDDVVLAVNGRTVLCSRYGSVSVMAAPGQEPAPPNPNCPPGATDDTVPPPLTRAPLSNYLSSSRISFTRQLATFAPGCGGLRGGVSHASMPILPVTKSDTSPATQPVNARVPSGFQAASPDRLPSFLAAPTSRPHSFLASQHSSHSSDLELLAQQQQQQRDLRTTCESPQPSKPSDSLRNMSGRTSPSQSSFTAKSGRSMSRLFGSQSPSSGHPEASLHIEDSTNGKESRSSKRDKGGRVSHGGSLLSSLLEGLVQRSDSGSMSRAPSSRATPMRVGRQDSESEHSDLRGSAPIWTPKQDQLKGSPEDPSVRSLRSESFHVKRTKSFSDVLAMTMGRGLRKGSPNTSRHINVEDNVGPKPSGRVPDPLAAPEPSSHPSPSELQQGRRFSKLGRGSTSGRSHESMEQHSPQAPALPVITQSGPSANTKEGKRTISHGPSLTMIIHPEENGLLFGPGGALGVDAGTVASPAAAPATSSAATAGAAATSPVKTAGTAGFAANASAATAAAAAAASTAAAAPPQSGGGASQAKESDAAVANEEPDEHNAAEDAWEQQAEALLGPAVFDVPVLTLGSRRAQLQASDAGAPAFATHNVTQVRRAAARERSGVAPDPAPEQLYTRTSFTVPLAPPDLKAPLPPAPPTEKYVLKLLVVADQAMFQVPHDEMPMRVYLFCETWAKAVSQVWKPCVVNLKASLATLNDMKRKGKPSLPGVPKSPAPGKYVELVLDTRRLSLVLAQHPMESWLALHATALKRTAAQRQLWERLLASMPSLSNNTDKDAQSVKGGRAAFEAAGAHHATAAPIRRLTHASGSFVSVDMGDMAHEDGERQSDAGTHVVHRMSSTLSDSIHSSMSSSDGAGSSSSSGESAVDDDGSFFGHESLSNRELPIAERVSANLSTIADTHMSNITEHYGRGSGVANVSVSAKAAGTSFSTGRGNQWESAMRNLVCTYILACRKIADSVSGSADPTIGGTSSTGGPLWVAYGDDPGASLAPHAPASFPHPYRGSITDKPSGVCSHTHSLQHDASLGGAPCCRSFHSGSLAMNNTSSIGGASSRSWARQGQPSHQPGSPYHHITSSTGDTPFASAAAAAVAAAGLPSSSRLAGGYGASSIGGSYGVSETEGVEASEGQCAPASADSARGSLMHVYAARGVGIIMVAKPKLVHHAHLSNTVTQLDPPSQGMLWQRLTGISMDVGLGDVVVRLGVVKDPVLTANLINLAGSIIRARQQGFTPATFDKIFRVGAYHAASIPTPIKGARPPMKTYTDLRCQMDDLAASGGMGLEPTIAQLAKAFKRLIPPDNMKPDGTAVSSLPGNPRLKQHDKMRYVWRGTIRLNINRMKLIFGTGLVAQPIPQFDPSAVLTANTLCLNVGTGKMDVASTGVALTAHARPPSTPGLGDPLLILPFFYLPLLNVCTSVKWFMPHGRDPLDHHIYPRVTDWDQLQCGRIQGPVDAVQIISAESCSVGLDFSLARDHTSAGKRTTDKKMGGSPILLSHHFSTETNGLQPSSVSRLYLGELQVAFIKDLIRLFSNPPAHLKSSSKRRAFYEPLRPMGPAAAAEVAAATGVLPGKLLAAASSALPPKAGTEEAEAGSIAAAPPAIPGSGPVLMTRLDVGVNADVVELYHDAQDAEDPSDLIVLRLINAFYSSSFSYFPTTRTVERSNRTYTKLSKRKVMTALTVEARNLQLAKMLGTNPTAGERKSSEKQPEGCGDTGNGLNPDLQFGKGLILSACCIMLKQAPLRHGGTTWGEQGRPGSEKRPMRIVVQDTKLLVSLELRDVCVATATHLMTAFSSQKPPPKPASFCTKQDREHATQEAKEKEADNVKKTGPSAPGGGIRGMDRLHTMGRNHDPGRDAHLQDEDVLLRQLVEAHKQHKATQSPASQHLSPDEPGTEGAPQDAAAGLNSSPPISPPSNLPEMALPPSSSSRSLKRTSSSGDRSVSLSDSLKRVADGLQLVLEVEFKRLQICLVPENCSGSLLLSTDTALLTLQLVPETGERRIELTMDHLQAYASRPLRSRGSGGSGPSGKDLPWLQPAVPAPVARPLSRADTAHDSEGSPSSARSAAQPVVSVHKGPAASATSKAAPLHKRQQSAAPGGGSTNEDTGLGLASMGGTSPLRSRLQAYKNTSTARQRAGPLRSSRLSWNGHGKGDGSSDGGECMALGVRSAGLTVPQGESGGLSAIMLPFNMRLVHARVPSKEDQDEDGNAKEEGDTNELIMQVPFVEGQLDSWQFDLIMDLITNMFMAPMPKVPILLVRSTDQQVCIEAAAAGLKESTPICGEVSAVSETLVSLRQQLHCLQQELSHVSPNVLHALRAVSEQADQSVPNCPSLHQMEAALSLVPPSMEYHPSLLAHSQQGSAAATTANALARKLQVLVAWSLDQVMGAADSVSATDSVLTGLHERMAVLSAALTRKRASKVGFTSSTIVLGGLQWGLSRGGSVFVVAELSGLEFITTEDQAGLGSTRLQLHRILLRDTQKLVGKAPGMDPGVILSLWNPGGHAASQRESEHVGEGSLLMQEHSPWEHDNALTLHAMHGGKDPRVVVYDHIEVVLHPLLVHITFNLAQTLQDYFNLREPDEANPSSSTMSSHAPSASAVDGAGLPPKGQARKVPAKKPGWLHRHSAQGQKAHTSEGGLGPGGPVALFSPLEAGRMRLGVQQFHPHSSPHHVTPDPLIPASNPTFSLPFNAIGIEGDLTGTASVPASAEPNRFGSMVRRNNRWQSRVIPAAAQSSSQGPLTSSMAKHTKTAPGYRARSFKGGSISQLPNIAPSQHHHTLTSVPSGGSSGSQQQLQPAERKEKPKKVYRFTHVRFNRMHVRLSYEGPPLSVTNFMLVLDASVYRGLEGGWRTILNRYKKDVIVSLLKSITGWQHRKVKELERGAAAAAAASAASAADSTGLSNLKHTDPEALLAARCQSTGDSSSVQGHGRHKGLRSQVKSFLGNIGVMHASSAETGGSSAVKRSSAEEQAITDLIAASQRAHMRQQKVALLLGPNVPIPPARKLLQQG